MEKTPNHPTGEPQKVFIKGYTTATGRVVPDHYRLTRMVSDAPKGTFIERRLTNPKRPR